MGALISDPKLWAALLGLITILVGLYRSFLSKKARLKKEQKERNQQASEEKEVLLSEAVTEIIDVNEQIEKSNQTSKNYFEGKNMIDSKIWELIKAQSKISNLDPIVLGAIVYQESGGNPWAMRYEPLWAHGLVETKRNAAAVLSSEHTEEILQKSSLGLCQVMGVVARELGFKGWLTQLFKPEIGLLYGAMVLSKNISRFKDLQSAISAYNAGSPKKDSQGDFINQDYVDSVYRHMKELSKVQN